MTKNIHQRMAEVMKTVTYIQKDKKAGMRYTVVSHDAVTAKVRPALLDAGVIYYPVKTHAEQVGNRTQAHMTVRFANVDDPSDHIDVETFGYGVDDSDKGPGKAMSYAVKYALLKALGLETGDDPDVDQDTKFHADPVNDDKSVRAYIELFKKSLSLAETVDDVRPMWQDGAYAREKLGIKPGSLIETELHALWVARGKELKSHQQEAA